MESHIDRAYKVLGAHHDVDEKDGKQNSHDPGANEALNRLLGGELDELGAAKGNATNIGENIVRDDEGGG